MSKTVPICFGDTMFWAYDVAVTVLFVEAARVAVEPSTDLRPAWWPELERDLLTQAIVGSSSAVLLDRYDVDQRQALLTCVAEAARRIEVRGGVSRDEAEAWPELDGAATGALRGAEHLDAAPLAELAQAMADLAAGTLAPAPPGRHWFFGTPHGRIVQGE